MPRAAVLAGTCALFLLCGSLHAQQSSSEYRLRPGDEVSVTVRPRREFDCGGILLPDGYLHLANVGKIRAAGLTVSALTERITEILGEELRAPRVTVALVRLGPEAQVPAARPGTVTVVGAVARPGPLALEEGMRLRRAIDLAGGVDRDADLRRILILRRDLTRIVLDLSSEEKLSDPKANILLKDGDSVDVARIPPPPGVAPLPRVRIGGAVTAPGSYELRDGMTLEDLIIAAGRLSPLADVRAIPVQRANARVSVDLEERRTLGRAGRFLLEPGDEVWVNEMPHRFALIGAVPSPGVKPLRPGLRVRQLLVSSDDALANSINPSLVDLNGTQLLRKDQPARRLKLADVMRKAGHGDDVLLQDGDVLFLPPKRGPKRSAADYLLQFGPLAYLFGLFR